MYDHQSPIHGGAIGQTYPLYARLRASRSNERSRAAGAAPWRALIVPRIDKSVPVR